jgi:CRISPR/Cas system endoribonuclease Cas6 (RAMP superfamily)
VELLNKQHLGAQAHIKSLLRSSLNFRRNWLSWKNSGSASTSTEKFPQLLNDDLVSKFCFMSEITACKPFHNCYNCDEILSWFQLTYEVSLMQKVTVDQMIENLSRVTRTLAQVFNKELSLSSDISQSEELSDSIKCSVYQRLAKKLAPRQLSKHASPLITVSTVSNLLCELHYYQFYLGVHSLFSFVPGCCLIWLQRFGVYV